MKNTLLLLLIAVLAAIPSHAQHLLPRPQTMTATPQEVTISFGKIKYKGLRKADRQGLSRYLATLPVTKGQGRPITLHLLAGETADELEQQHYTLDIDCRGATISATHVAGLFYGMQTLLQLADGGSTVPYCHIDDKPRFAYRGLMLDCSRHFWSKNFILKQIDAIAYMKLNRLHLHLTDAGGWRMEVKRYPQLTERGAWRSAIGWDEWWTSGLRTYTAPHEGYGGYYTQAELREIVAYAADRHVTVIPEIEMPGHSEEVCYALPEISCTGKPGAGEMCIGKDKTFEVLQNILDEVMDIFPSEYIHIGGDECSRQTWEKCPDCQRRMAEEKLATTAELQSYMTERIERYLNSHGRQLMGWDEILEGRLAPHATVMSWRGIEGGLKAAAMGHEVVMTPGATCYLDKYQDAPNTQPRAFGGYLPLENVYAYEPVPAELAGTPGEHFIKGLQGNLWTEMVADSAHCEYMIYPRIMAVAEIGWSSGEKDYADFHRRAAALNHCLHNRGYHVFDLDHEVGRRAESVAPQPHLALGAQINYIGEYHEAYQGHGPATLVDGRHGNWSYGDGEWQGFIGQHRFDVVIDLGEVKTIHEIKADFMQFTGPEIFGPADVEISVSDDGADYQSLYRQDFEIDLGDHYFIRPYGWKGECRARYIHYQAHSGRYGGWLFTDEVEVR